MKGSKKVIDTLNMLLADELGAINQYMVHSEMFEDWGYSTLHDVAEKRAIGEMKHAEQLIARILFLEGQPIVDKLAPIHIGADVAGMFANDHAAELDAVGKYNAAIKLCVDEKDNGSKEMLDGILKDEEDHIDYIEEQLDQIDQMGLQVYLSTKS